MGRVEPDAMNVVSCTLTEISSKDLAACSEQINDEQRQSRC